MSLTPVDEPDQRGASATDGDEDPRSLTARIARRARRAVESLGRVVGSALGREDRTEIGSREQSAASDHAHRHPLTRLDPDSDIDGPNCPEVDDLPARKRPLTYPAREGSVSNDPDLVATRDAETLTLELPGEPEAHISSDTWERLEP
jgi:hypothetical protein